MQTTSKQVKKVRDNLDKQYGYLGGNALTRDKKGNVTKDSQADSEMQMAHGGADGEYSAYVCYEFEIV